MNHIERLKIGKEELQEKIIKLEQFIDSDRFEVIDERQKVLLKTQHSSMITYHFILLERLK